MKFIAWSAAITPPLPKISPLKSGFTAVSAHFLRANGLKTAPQAPPYANYSF